jgi:hypothetical protein
MRKKNIDYVENLFKQTVKKYVEKEVALKVCAEGLNIIHGHACEGENSRRLGLNGHEPKQGGMIVPKKIEAMLTGILLSRGLSNNNFLEKELGASLIDDLSKYYRNHGEIKNAEHLPTFDWNTGSKEYFAENYVKTPHPVVIKNFSSPAQSWSVDYFLDTYPDLEVLLTDMGSKENYNGTLQSLVDKAPSGSAAYIHNYEDIFDKFPSLIDDLGLERLSPYLDRPYTSFAHQLFLGVSRGSGTPYHCADVFNFFYQLEGRKRWVFVDPNYMFLLYPFLSKGNGYQTSLVDGIRPEAEDFSLFPLYEYCPRYTVDLSPGDILLNPPHWYHAVENLSEKTTAVATRWSSGDVVGNRLYRFLRLNADRTKKLWDSHDEAWGEVASGAAVDAWFNQQERG